MTQVNEKEFLNKLQNVVNKLSSIAKTQGPRFKHKWDAYLTPLNINPHVVRQISVEKEKFLTDLDYRISILQSVDNSFVDGCYSIKSLLTTLYNSYFDNSELFKNDFLKEDQLILKYIVAREILGNLIQFNQMEPEIVPLKYNIIAREYMMIKLKGIKLEDIAFSLGKLNKNVSKEILIKTMEEIRDDGIIKIENDNGTNLYTLNKDLVLSNEGKKTYDQNLYPLVAWPTLFWRSYYNIRELNVTPDPSVIYADFLKKVLSKSATQGFSACHYVFQNLVKYYEKIKDEFN